MFNLGLQGTFGGGFIQSPGADANQPAGGAGVTYSLPFYRTRPKDRSGRRDSYLNFPVGTDQTPRGVNLRRGSK